MPEGVWISASVNGTAKAAVSAGTAQLGSSKTCGKKRLQGGLPRSPYLGESSSSPTLLLGTLPSLPVPLAPTAPALCVAARRCGRIAACGLLQGLRLAGAALVLLDHNQVLLAAARAALLLLERQALRWRAGGRQPERAG